MQNRAWPQGQNMPCAPTDHPMPNLTEGVLNTQLEEGQGIKPTEDAEYTARGQSISSQKVGHTSTRMRQRRSLDFQLGSWRELATVYILVGTMYSKYNKIIG